MTKHYRRSPSGAARWLACPASLTYGLPDRGSAAADEGTAAHEAANRWLVDGVEPDDPTVRNKVRRFIEIASSVRERCGQWVVDYKNGYHNVTAEGNEQLLCYALILSRRWRHVEKWNLVICQPNGTGPTVDWWETDSTAIEEHERRIVERVKPEHADEHEPGDHCKFCPGLLCCQAGTGVRGGANRLRPRV